MQILSNKMPKAMGSLRKGLKDCLKRFDAALPVERVILFGSRARGRAYRDSDVDLCVVVRGILSQYGAACRLRRSIGRVRGKPPLTLIPISPERLAEKIRAHDPFFETVLKEGICIAEKD